MLPIPLRIDWNAYWPLRNASTYIVMLPSVSFDAAASSAIAP